MILQIINWKHLQIKGGFSNILVKSIRGKESNVLVLNKILSIQKKFGVGTYHAKNLLKAFTMDSTNKKRYSDWNDLMNYWKYSANPVGRFVIDLRIKLKTKGKKFKTCLWTRF